MSRSRAWAACALAVAVVSAGAVGDPSRGSARADGARLVRPYESAAWEVPATTLDRCVAAAQRRAGVQAAAPCSDETFVRRVFLDAIGTLPEPREVREFLLDRRPDRRARLIDRLLARDEFADYQALRWCDVLRVKSEFPINLWPNAVQAYDRWVRDEIRANRPYDRFARALLTSSGSNFREPAVNFWRAVRGRDPGSLASAVALTFLGTRIDAWPEERRRAFAALFTRVAYKTTGEWKEEIVLLDPGPSGHLEAVLPDGTPVLVPPDADPRAVFADWLVRRENPWFARAAVNRVWAWIFGRGLVEPADDLRDGNPPAIPEALSHLEKSFADSGWDLRALWRQILVSRTYQQSPVPRGDPEDAAALFAVHPVRRLDAEVLLDALCRIGGAGEEYTSTVPEPWTFIPADRRTITLADGTITSTFLEMFGRPARDTGLLSERDLTPSGAQALHLLNSTAVLRRIERSPRLRPAYEAARSKPGETARELWMTLLSREPTAAEADTAERYLRDRARTPRESAVDLAWALVNSKEFLHRH